MNKMEILEAMYETISESLDWAFECRDDDYAYYIDGVVSATEKMIEKSEEKYKELVKAMKSAKVISAEA